MPTEIEIKLRVTSHEPVRRKLTELHAVPLGSVVETNWILDRPDGSLRRQGRGLRIREAKSPKGETTATWTYKGPPIIASVKSREEIETTIGDAAVGVQVLDRLGYVIVLQYEKRRESWSLDGCNVELDEPARLGLFVEIEGASETSIQKLREKLDLQKAESVTASYVQLVAEYCERNAISPRVLTLGCEAQRGVATAPAPKDT